MEETKFIKKKEEEINKKRVYIRNIPLKVFSFKYIYLFYNFFIQYNVNQLKNLFSEFKGVQNIIIPTKSNGYLKGFSFINFNKKKYAKEVFKKIKKKIFII